MNLPIRTLSHCVAAYVFVLWLGQFLFVLVSSVNAFVLREHAKRCGYAVRSTHIMPIHETFRLFNNRVGSGLVNLSTYLPPGPSNTLTCPP